MQDGNFSVHFGNDIYFESESGAEIRLNGDLHLGASWTRKQVFPFLLKMAENARLTINGKFKLYEGSAIYINKDAQLSLGSGYINNRLNLSCFSKITIGQGVNISEGVTIRDTDNHTIVSPNYKITAPIVIEDHVWIGMNVTILKGVSIGAGSVIAAGAVVNKDIPPGCLAAGVPARVIKQNIEWK
jgi:acetyltransferase-like isoleucine patch superfamily enzyme